MNRITVLKILFVPMVFISTSVFAEYRDIQVEFSHDGNSENKIAFVFKGEIYDEKYTFEYLKKRMDTSKATAVEILMYDNLLANESGSKKDILKFWEKKEHARIKKLMDDPEMFKKNQAFYRNINSSKLMAVVLYGSYILCYINHDLQGVGDYIKVYPLVVIEGNKILLTNDLAQDYFFNQMSDDLGKYIHENYQ